MGDQFEPARADRGIFLQVGEVTDVGQHGVDSIVESGGGGFDFEFEPQEQWALAVEAGLGFVVVAVDRGVAGAGAVLPVGVVVGDEVEAAGAFAVVLVEAGVADPVSALDAVGVGAQPGAVVAGFVVADAVATDLAGPDCGQGGAAVGVAVRAPLPSGHTPRTQHGVVAGEVRAAGVAVAFDAHRQVIDTRGAQAFAVDGGGGEIRGRQPIGTV
ncbi:hypothetical protein AB0E01_41840 [Nocardia vinacea]|uniref:hypothetical protein n=1 Tax=Nocardia vinacea TaxID=96468 RepID=UPI0033FDD3EE